MQDKKIKLTENKIQVYLPDNVLEYLQAYSQKNATPIGSYVRSLIVKQIQGGTA